MVYRACFLYSHMDSVKKEHTLLSRAPTGSRKGKLGCELVCTCAAPVGKLNLIHWSILTEESADVTEIVPELDFIVCLSCYHARCCFVALLQIILFISGSPSSVRAAKTGSFRKAFLNISREGSVFFRGGQNKLHEWTEIWHGATRENNNCVL